MRNNKKLRIQSLVFMTLWVFVFVFISCTRSNKKGDYKGTPFKDKKYNSGAQTIPGKLQCEYYDYGGEGVAFHDSDSINSGSGKFNKPDGTYLNEYRKNEAVDVSYTKFRDPPVDNSEYNFVETQANQLYLGWTAPGEWLKYTIEVRQTGEYQLGIMLTSRFDGKIALSINDKVFADSLLIPSTYVVEDSIEWRQWHHWNYLDNIVMVKLNKGIHVLTLDIIEAGGMNFDYIDFKLKI